MCANGNISDWNTIILNAKAKPPNNVIVVEYGRLPISVICKQRILMYWFKIIHKKDFLV